MITKRSLIATGLALPVSRPRPSAAAPQETVLRLGYLASRDSQIGRGSAELVEQVRRLTGGRVRIEGYPNSQLGGEADILRDLEQGTLEMGFLTSAALSSFLPAMGIFDIPFLFRDLTHARAVMDGPIGREALAAFEARGIVALAWGENGFRHVTTAARPVRGAADLRGLRIRVPQSEVMLAAFKALGAEARPLAFNELYAMLATGEFDAQENPISLIIASRFYAVQKHLTLTAHVYSPAIVLIGKASFAALGDADQAAIRQAGIAAAAVSRAQSELADKAGVEALQSRGMQVTRDYDRASFVAALAPAEPVFARLFGRERIEAIRNTGKG
ncbi:TRAP transporter substrate-binding protein DctP [Roseicella aquatilis]|uniref:DctP family TRAP transporter solute-binding subunit n=1 Tax=Roseicella aquatilis TaxID=2527868 RepID=A0A4R4D638_9PROT|nr:TRAP transporter substrate-binding protein DctP [Roseicella aquatilis]TCZ54230.1 DctP family TRAP transporter solute-binding subunit [Roseicella aquatilis]